MDSVADCRGMVKPDQSDYFEKIRDVIENVNEAERKGYDGAVIPSTLVRDQDDEDESEHAEEYLSFSPHLDTEIRNVTILGASPTWRLMPDGSREEIGREEWGTAQERLERVREAVEETKRRGGFEYGSPGRSRSREERQALKTKGLPKIYSRPASSARGGHEFRGAARR